MVIGLLSMLELMQLRRIHVCLCGDYDTICRDVFRDSSWRNSAVGRMQGPARFLWCGNFAYLIAEACKQCCSLGQKRLWKMHCRLVERFVAVLGGRWRGVVTTRHRYAERKSLMDLDDGELDDCIDSAPSKWISSGECGGVPLVYEKSW